MKLALFLLMSFGVIVVPNYGETVEVQYNCTFDTVLKGDCQIFDFSKPNCYPWNTSKCPDPEVILKVTACNVYSCTVSFPVTFFKQSN